MYDIPYIYMYMYVKQKLKNETKNADNYYTIFSINTKNTKKNNKILKIMAFKLMTKNLPKNCAKFH